MNDQAERVLVADDEEGLRLILSRQLEMDGFAVTTASDGLKAIETLESQEFSAIVTDMRMPGAEGLEVLRAAKERWPNTEVIIMTAHGSVENVIQAVQTGNLFDYLVKPFDDIREISIVVRKACERRRLSIENEQLQTELDGVVSRLNANSQRLLQAGKMVSTGQIAGAVAEEIRSPLESVASIANYLCSKFGGSSWEDLDMGDRDRLFAGLQRMDMAARHCKGVLDTLLRYSRPDSGEFTDLDLNAVLTDTLALTEQRVLRAGLRLETSFSPDVPAVVGSASQLQQVFTNLVLNSVDQTPEGGCIRVTTSRLESDPPTALVTVEDSGRCTTSEIFDEAESELGMAISQDIVRAHRGKIEAHCRIGEGMTVRLTLPGLGEISLPTHDYRAA